MFSYCSLPEISIADLSRRHWDIGLRRVLSPKELEDWHHLVALLPVLSKMADAVVWPHSNLGRFSVKPLYTKLMQGAISNRFTRIWKAKTPLKFKIFMWQAM